MNSEKLISQFKTPFYAFDLNVLSDRINYIKSSLPDNVDICYAVKANTFIIAEAEKHVSRLEVCSQGEFEICEKAGAPMSKIVLSGVYKTPEFIDYAVSRYDDIGIYTVESVRQYELLKQLAEKYGRKLYVLVRINSKNQFGVTEDDFRHIIEDKNDFIDLRGIQYFSSTQKSSYKKLNREFTYLCELIKRIEDEYNITIDELEYGTGSPVTYFKEESFDEDEYFRELSRMLSELPIKAKITLEIGRSIAACCGTYYTGVVDMKKNKTGNFAIVDGGINHIVYYGQSMAMKHPHFDVYPKREGDDTLEWNICGSLCTVNDIIVKALPISSLNIGDVLIFKNTGAYCMCEGISLFLSRELPAVLLVDKEEVRLVRDHLKTSALNG